MNFGGAAGWLAWPGLAGWLAGWPYNPGLAGLAWLAWPGWLADLVVLLALQSYRASSTPGVLLHAWACLGLQTLNPNLGLRPRSVACLLASKQPIHS